MSCGKVCKRLKACFVFCAECFSSDVWFIFLRGLLLCAAAAASALLRACKSAEAVKYYQREELPIKVGKDAPGARPFFLCPGFSRQAKPCTVELACLSTDTFRIHPFNQQSNLPVTNIRGVSNDQVREPARGC